MFWNKNKNEHQINFIQVDQVRVAQDTLTHRNRTTINVYRWRMKGENKSSVREAKEGLFAYRCSWHSWPVSRSTRTPPVPSATSRYASRSERVKACSTSTSSGRFVTLPTSRSSASRQPTIPISEIPRSIGNSPNNRFTTCSVAQVIWSLLSAYLYLYFCICIYSLACETTK